jgi:hypothetical protein
MSRLALRRIGVFLYCALIFYLSSRNDYPKTLAWWPGRFPEPSLIVHFLLYAGLSFFVLIDFRRETWELLRRNAAVVAVVFCAFYGLSDEVHQLFVPLRTFELRDIAMDTLGSVASMVFFRLLGWTAPPAEK